MELEGGPVVLVAEIVKDLEGLVVEGLLEDDLLVEALMG